jgi:A/G-specific adenine glycosylase
MPTSQQIQDFRETVWGYYRQYGRAMPWRDDPSPYRVLVSELMLQQTQVSRVVPKFDAFLQTFPTIQDLAAAPLSAVLVVWSGLGYNRRAKFLHMAAQYTVEHFDGELPSGVADLVKLPGVGPNTAGAIAAYAFEQPSVFIETNIRTVYLHHFFADVAHPVRDADLWVIVEATLDTEHPREWYWALMDYGTYLKKEAGGRLDQSATYRKQSKLDGSLRQMRGWIVAHLAAGKGSDELAAQYATDPRFEPALQALAAEGIVSLGVDSYGLTER